MTAELPDADRPLLALLGTLQARGYRFVTPTPATHARVLKRPDRREAHDLAGALGWSLPFRQESLDPEIVALLDAGGMIEPFGALLKARVRVSSLGNRLLLHSAYPTDDDDAVFFGPDSYRFADFIRRALRAYAANARIVDIGTGAGAGAIAAHEMCPGAAFILTDINAGALRLARINCAHAGLAAELVESRTLDGINDPIDVALANPPYIIDAQGRAYRDGGDMHGGRIALDMASAAAERLAPGGRLLLYTGSAIVDGHDDLRAALARALAERDCDLDYHEIDPDVFGEELDGAAYADVDRIAVVGAVAVKRGGPNPRLGA